MKAFSGEPAAKSFQTNGQSEQRSETAPRQILPALVRLVSQTPSFFLASPECQREKGATSWRTPEELEGKCSVHISETRKRMSLTPASVHSGSEVREKNGINLSGSGEGRSKEIKMLKNDIAGHKLNVEAIIKNINTISLELKKMKELSQLLLCDLTLHFRHPGKTDDVKETAANSSPFEEFKTPDVSLAPNSFSP